MSFEIDTQRYEEMISEIINFQQVSVNMGLR